ncbi:DUF2931 family protein [Gynuella sunshinyii]|uniref:DUF2931 family protein n=1 Tax=Gynuella sunshinyii YC6258 TaxID=1445510 RepID=A0A0C5V473_9GAMM|nr:DUF2931 family protein [Gynuella sunshinyii]AJQ94250.1 hypothetical Protein YC6258_02212 [Gynuella sunshinyii YC6258]
MHIIKYIGWLLFLPLLISGCEEKTYDYGFDTGGFGGPGWPIWVEYLIINESWQLPVGNLSGGNADTTHRPPGGSSAGAGWVPLPHTVRARWFSYRTQTFYEATVEIPKDKQTEIKQWLKHYPSVNYLHSLSTGIAGQGDIQLWWKASCVGFDCPEYPEPFESHFFELTPRIKAIQVDGDASGYRAGTLQRIEEGFLPPDVLNLLPPDPDKTEAIEKDSSTENTGTD